MRIIETVSEWQLIRSQCKTQTLGFVPTMGCLHEGHASLLDRSINENELTVLCIFVNPTQFNEQSDYDRYPRTEAADIELARSMGVDYLFKPSVESMYPHGTEFTGLVTRSPMSQILEGKYRPGHFDGVLIVVLKLLTLIQPARAYFGEKDYQQLQLIRELASNFFLTGDIVGCQTVREPSGLALSSRNKRLTEHGHQTAQKMAQLFHRYSVLSEAEILSGMAALNIDVEYLQAIDGRAYLAARIEGVRLIDNIKLIS